MVAVFFTSNMSKTDSGDAVGTDKGKQANNLKDSSIKGFNQKISGKDPNLQELPFQKNVSSEVGLKDSNNIATETNLSGNNDQHRLANLRTKGCSVDSRSVSSSNSAEKRKRETDKTVESISLSGYNHSRESSSRRGPSRDGTSLIPGRVNSKLAESASSNKAPETVVSGSGSSLMRADDPVSTEGSMARRSRRITDTPKMANYAKNIPDSGGLSGVNSEIKARLAEIGLKHVPVSPQGNCFFLAASFGLFKKTSKFLEVRRAGAKYVEENIEQLKDQVVEGECEETMTSLRAMGAHVDELGITAVSLAYGRPIEIWQRSPYGDGIESHTIRGIADNLILMWYNGLRLRDDGQGNHYDALEIVDQELFNRRSEKCTLTQKRNGHLTQVDLPQVVTVVPMELTATSPSNGAGERIDQEAQPGLTPHLIEGLHQQATLLTYQESRGDMSHVRTDYPVHPTSSVLANVAVGA